MYIGLKRMMERALTKANRKCHVLLIYESMIPSVHLCGDGQLSELERMGRIEYQKKTTLRVTRETIEWADVTVLCRLDTSLGCELAKRLHDAQKYVIYMLDDDLLEVPNCLSVSAYYTCEDTRNHIRRIIELSNAILSTSQKVLEKYRYEGGRSLLVDGFAECFTEFEPHKGRKSIKIGFAGSLDRSRDVDTILSEALIRVKQTYGDRVHFEFMGVKPDCAERIQADVLPYTESYKQYRKVITSLEWDIGLAPMPDTEFHSCKYINKYIEYASAGAAGVFSRVEPYLRLSREMGVGELCENTTDAWYEALCALIEDDERRECARKTAYEYVRQKMNLHAVSERFFEELKEVFGYRAPETAWKYGLAWQKARHIVSKGWIVARKYGLKLPTVILRKLKGRS